MLIEVGRAKLSANRSFDEVKAFRANLTVSEYLKLGFVGDYPKSKAKPKADEPKAENKSRKGKTND